MGGPFVFGGLMSWFVDERDGKFSVFAGTKTEPGEALGVYSTKAEAVTSLVALADKHAADAFAKALPGSIEYEAGERKRRIKEAIKASGLFGDYCYITDTFDDRVVVETYSKDYETRKLYEVEYTDDGTAVTLGSAREVVKVYTESLEAVGGSAANGGSNGAPAVADGAMELSSAPEPDTKSDSDDGAEVHYKAFALKAEDFTESEINGVRGFVFEGYASKWGIVDLEGDVTVKGCFTQTLREGLPLVKEEHIRTVGRCIDAKEDDIGLWVKGFVPHDDATSFLYKLMKIGAVAQMSYGWKAYAGGTKRLNNGNRQLTNIKLYEVSPVSFGMLPDTEILSVKAMVTDRPIAEVLSIAAREILGIAQGAKAHALSRFSQDREVGGKTLEALELLEMASYDVALTSGELQAKAGRRGAKAKLAELMAIRARVDALIATYPEKDREAAAWEGAENTESKALPDTLDLSRLESLRALTAAYMEA